MNSSDQQAVQSYLDELLGAPAPRQQPRFAEPEATTALQEQLFALEQVKRQQLQALLDRQMPVSLQVESPVDQIHTEHAAVATATPATESAPHTSPLLQWCDNGRPVWAQGPFDVLLFRVAGLTLAVPLIALGQIYPLKERLGQVFGQADWFMGLLPTSAGQIRTINTALFVMPERYDPSFAQGVRYVISIDGLDWGLAVDQVQQPTRLQPEDVTWRTERTRRPWLAGTVKTAMCALIDIPQMGRLLQQQDRNRQS
jgi:purine-binding chemotaxis protein CheW